MKNFLKLSLLFLPLILLTGCTINNQENENNSNNISERISYRVEENDKVQSNNHLTRYEPKVETKTIEEPIELKQNEVLSSFSTKIYDKNTNRMNNLKLVHKH